MATNFSGAAKNIFSRTPFEIDHFGSVKDDPFKNIRIIPRTINQAAGQFQRGVSTFKDIKQAEDFIGYNFTGDPLQSINNYINTEITRGQDPNYTGRATKIFSCFYIIFLLKHFYAIAFNRTYNILTINNLIIF